MIIIKLIFMMFMAELGVIAFGIPLILIWGYFNNTSVMERANYSTDGATIIINKQAAILKVLLRSVLYPISMYFMFFN